MSCCKGRKFRDCLPVQGVIVAHATRFLLCLAMVGGAPLPAQQPVTTQALPPVDSLQMMLSGSRRAKISRAQLEASLAEIEAALASSGYSGALKVAREAEAQQIRRRLEEGDLYPGDVIALQVFGDPQMSNTYGVTPRRTIRIPGIPDEVPLTGLLRSEVEEYLQGVVSQYVRSPTVWAEPLLRVAIFGAVVRPGYFIVPSSLPLPDIIMQYANGPAPNADPSRGGIYRGEREVIPGEAIEEAIREARSIDALNLQSGDRIEYGARPSQGFLGRAVAIVGGAASLAWLLVRIF